MLKPDSKLMNRITIALGVVAMGLSATAFAFHSSRLAQFESRRLLEETTSLREQEAAIQAQVSSKRERLTPLQVQIAQRVGSPPTKVDAGEFPLGAATWQSDLPYVDVPKRVLRAIQMKELSPNGAVDPLVAELLMISAAEKHQLQELFDHMRAQSEALERSHLESSPQHLPESNRSPGQKMTFVLRPFPQERDALKLEWRSALEQIVGMTRADLIFKAPLPGTTFQPTRLGLPLLGSRGGPPIPPQLRGGGGGQATFSGSGGGGSGGFSGAGGGGGGSGGSGGITIGGGGIGNPGTSWLTRGGAEEKITFVLESAPAVGQGYTYFSLSGNSRFNASGAPIPARWQHLITPETLIDRKAPRM